MTAVLRTTLLAALLAATAACVPTVSPATRLSTSNDDTPCRFQPGSCAGLHTLSASVR